MVIRCGTGTPAVNRALLVAPAVLFVYSVLCDPVWTVVPFLSLGIFIAAALLVDRRGATDRWRGGAVLFGAASLAALSVPAYLETLLRYTARSRFRTEIVGEVQDRFYAFLPFQNARTAVLFLLLLGGALLALRARERPARIFAACCLAHMALMTGLSLAYRYADINWTYPLPAYLQLPAMPVYLLAATAGGQAGFSLLLERVPRLAGRLRPLSHPLLAVSLLPAAGLALITAQAVAEDAPPALLPIPGGEYLIRSDQPFALLLERRLAGRPGGRFQGSVASVYPDASAPEYLQLFSRLSGMGVPSLEEYSQLVSPPLYFLVSRGLGRPEDGPAAGTASG